MARSVTSPAEQKRRREIMAAALERARASRLAFEAAAAAAQPTATLKAAEAAARGAGVPARGDARTADSAEVAPRCGTGRHVAALQSGDAAESPVTTWLREHGDATTMTVVSNDEINGRRRRVWVIRCGACDTVIRVTGAANLQKHATCAAHAAAVDPAHAPASVVATWLREHGEANTMTVVSNELNGGAKRVWCIRCDACEKLVRFKRVRNLQSHANCAAHLAALESGNAPEPVVVTWLRENGEINTMTVISNKRLATGHREWVVWCAACAKELRFESAPALRAHVKRAAHAAGLEVAPGATQRLTQHEAPRKRSRS
jgi:hypothetical protein